jgi:hypothetical protein
MDEVAPGIFHWTTWHEPIRGHVSSYYVVPAQVVLDPKVPAEGWEVLPGRPQQVLLTSGHHSRDADVFAERFDIPIRGSIQAAQYIGDALSLEVFNDADEVAPGITAIHIDKISDDEGAFHITAGGGAVAIADGINHYGGVLGFFPDPLLGAHPDRVKNGLKEAYTGVLLRDFEHLLFAHGDPLVKHGKTALRDFVTSPVGYEDFGQTL